MTRYNVIGYYPKHKDYCLICLGNGNKEQMEKILEEVKNNPQKFGIKPEDVTEYKLEKFEDTPDTWWNGNLD